MKVSINIVDGKADFKSLEAYVLDLPEIEHESGRLEVGATISRYLLTTLPDKRENRRTVKQGPAVFCWK